MGGMPHSLQFVGGTAMITAKSIASTKMPSFCVLFSSLVPDGLVRQIHVHGTSWRWAGQRPSVCAHQLFSPSGPSGHEAAAPARQAWQSATARPYGARTTASRRRSRSCRRRRARPRRRTTSTTSSPTCRLAARCTSWTGSSRGPSAWASAPRRAPAACACAKPRPGHDHVCLHTLARGLEQDSMQWLCLCRDIHVRCCA